MILAHVLLFTIILCCCSEHISVLSVQIKEEAAQELVQFIRRR